MQSVPTTTDVVGSSPAQGEVYNIGVNIFVLINYKYNTNYNNDNYNKFHNSNQPMGSENKL